MISLKQTSSSIKQRGIGLLELMLALAVIALLLLMATRYYTIVQRSQQTNAATSDISFLVSAIKTWRASQSSYAGISFEALSKIGALPDGFQSVAAGADSTTPNWGGCPTTVDVAASGTNSTTATLTFNNMRDVICRGLIQRLKKDEVSWLTVTSDESKCGTGTTTNCGTTANFVIELSGY